MALKVWVAEVAPAAMAASASAAVALVCPRETRMPRETACSIKGMAPGVSGAMVRRRMWLRAASRKRSKRGMEGGWRRSGGVDAAFAVGEERAFEVDADGLCFVGRSGGFDGVGKAFEGAEGGVDFGGDGGGEVVAGALVCEESLDFGEAGGGGAHDVVAGGAVDVDVEEGGGKDGFGADGGARSGTSVEMSSMSPSESMVMAG